MQNSVPSQFAPEDYPEATASPECGRAGSVGFLTLYSCDPTALQAILVTSQLPGEFKVLQGSHNIPG